MTLLTGDHQRTANHDAMTRHVVDQVHQTLPRLAISEEELADIDWRPSGRLS